LTKRLTLVHENIHYIKGGMPLVLKIDSLGSVNGSFSSVNSKNKTKYSGQSTAKP